MLAVGHCPPEVVSAMARRMGGEERLARAHTIRDEAYALYLGLDPDEAVLGLHVAGHLLHDYGPWRRRRPTIARRRNVDPPVAD